MMFRLPQRFADQMLWQAGLSCDSSSCTDCVSQLVHLGDAQEWSSTISYKPYSGMINCYSMFWGLFSLHLGIFGHSFFGCRCSDQLDPLVMAAMKPPTE